MKFLPSLLAAAALAVSCSREISLDSPDGSLELKIYTAGDSGELKFDLLKDGAAILNGNTLGLTTEDADWSGNLEISSAGKAGRITEDYRMITGKRTDCRNTANTRTIEVMNGNGDNLKVDFRLFNDGLAFRYVIEGGSGKVTGEHTSYNIPDGLGRWIQSYEKAGYEAFYPYVTDGRAQGSWRPRKQWGYPALVESGNGNFVLITEAGIRRAHCGSYLDNAADSCSYKVVLADKTLSYENGWESPWRVLISGGLDTVVESTLVTDVSDPCAVKDTSWIKPGTAAWIYWANNHGSSDYRIVCEYIDLAEQMGWPYDLIDAEWDVMTGGGDINDALDYAAAKGVLPMIWYNSSTNWINGAPTPHYRLNKKEDRVKEYTWLKEKGVKGIKVDFFRGDESVDMDYYIDLMEDAADYQLLINFHGATLPRGWQRTYPNLMTVEGVYGAEWYNNTPLLTKRAACHNATLPFTRNVVGSMDYTPGTFSDSQHPHITSDCHELALPVLFESGLQHMPDRPSVYLNLPEEVRNLLSTLPTTWDDTRLLAGYPGRDVVIARRKAGKWYVAGINGTDENRSVGFSLSRLREYGFNAGNASIFTDCEAGRGFNISHEDVKDEYSLELLPRGGFVMIFE